MNETGRNSYNANLRKIYISKKKKKKRSKSMDCDNQINAD